MEKDVTVKMFKRSIDRQKMRYMNFYGDGDTKSFYAIENIYPERKVRRYECVGHVQKKNGEATSATETNWTRSLSGPGDPIFFISALPCTIPAAFSGSQELIVGVKINESTPTPLPKPNVIIFSILTALGYFYVINEIICKYLF